MDYLKKRTLELLKRYNIRPKKRLGQSFLICDSTASLILDLLELKPTDTVLEIGSGLGLLTAMIAEKSYKVIAVEIDPILVKVMHEILANYINVEIIEANILDIVIPPVDKVFSNVPYYISSQLLFKLAKEMKFKKSILVFQKEFAQRLVATPSSRNYGRLSIMAQTFFNIKLIKIISKYCFYPVPEVDSAIVELTPNLKIPKEVINDFADLVTKIFSYRNKLLRKAIRISYGQQLIKFLEREGFSNVLHKRVRDLSIDDI
ncbi:MAG TPA: ribosomal RNA small subunit methyltransferase A, partial [Thermoproteales archaeon]|nr:ribosomal RNA small subunit methyltransferase A [Thermoproteales archaeon]